MDTQPPTTPETPEQELARLRSELATAEGLIAQQNEQLEAKQLQGAGQLPVLSYKQQYYQVQAAKFHFKGVDYTAEQLASNADLVKQLLEAKSGLLVKVDKPKQ